MMRPHIYVKKCKHFTMLINYVRDQVELGLSSVTKVEGTENDDMGLKFSEDGQLHAWMGGLN